LVVGGWSLVVSQEPHHQPRTTNVRGTRDRL